MSWLAIPGWATRPDIFSEILPENLDFELANLNFDNDGSFPEIKNKHYDGIICYSLGSLIALKAALKNSPEKIIFISGFTFFPGFDAIEARKRKMKINLMIKGLKRDAAKTLTDFYSEAGLTTKPSTANNVINLIHGLELLRDCDMSHALKNNVSKIFTIHGKNDSIVPEEMNRMQFNNVNHISLAGDHGIIQSKNEEIKKILSEII